MKNQKNSFILQILRIFCSNNVTNVQECTYNIIHKQTKLCYTSKEISPELKLRYCSKQTGSTTYHCPTCHNVHTQVMECTALVCTQVDTLT